MNSRRGAWTWRRALVAAVALLGAVGVATGVAATSVQESDSRARATGPLAVVLPIRSSTPGAYSILLMDVRGHVVAHAMASDRSDIFASGANGGVAAVPLPRVSASRSRVYYLDGDSQIRYLTPGGATGYVTRVPGGRRAHAAFAVSPDDRRIAVSVLDYGAPNSNTVTMRLYVEDLAGGRHHLDLFSSNLVFEWPVGWHNGALVLAVGPDRPYIQSGSPNPYNAWNGYHVVDAATSARLATICAAKDAHPIGPVVAAGTICGQPRGYYAQSWTGATRFFGRAKAYQALQALSPDGTRMAGWRDNYAVSLLTPTDRRTALNARGYPQGFIDATHLIVQSSDDFSLRILDLRAGAQARTNLQGEFDGVLPGGL